jgi:hypothetical protein
MLIASIAFSQNVSRNSIVASQVYYPPTHPDIIQVLFEYPTNFEIIGSIDVNKEVGFSKKKAKKKALNKAKKEAAKLGANAIVLLGYDRDMSFVSDQMNLSAIAIFITPQSAHNQVDSSDTGTQQTSSTTEELIALQKSLNNPDEFNIGDKVIFENEKRNCAGEIVEINRKKEFVVLKFYHERSGKILKTKRKFAEIKKFE